MSRLTWPRRTKARAARATGTPWLRRFTTKPAYFVTARNGGVGSLDESFAAALIAGTAIYHAWTTYGAAKTRSTLKRF